MASVRLTRGEARGRLPSVCIVCGQTATGFKSKQMSWHPSWVYILLLLGLLPFIIVALCVQKRMRVEAPFCARHQNHWLSRTLIIVFSLVAIIIVGVGASMLMAGQRAGPNDATGAICFGVIALGIAWLVLVAVLSMTAVRAEEITENSITLAGVSDEFVNALEESEADEDDDEPRPRRQRPPPPYLDDEEDDRPRRRPPPPDAFEERD
jgi:hypothetical protein